MVIELKMLLSLMYNFTKISLYSGIGLGILGLVFGIIHELVEAMVWIKSTLNNITIIQYNLYCINFYDYFIEYIFTVGYSIIWFSFVFIIVGLLLPSIVSILTTLYLINKYNQYFGKII